MKTPEEIVAMIGNIGSRMDIAEAQNNQKDEIYKYVRLYQKQAIALDVAITALEQIKRADYVNEFEDGELVKTLYSDGMASKALAEIEDISKTLSEKSNVISESEENGK
jgi:hypothetical protein